MDDYSSYARRGSGWSRNLHLVGPAAQPARRTPTSHETHERPGPVAGFLVDDVPAAAAELRSREIEILLESEVESGGNAWVHFRAPDGNIYELTQDPGVSRPH